MEKKDSFLIHIAGGQGTGWKGTITWMEQTESHSFRSLMELVRLMNHAVESE